MRAHFSLPCSGKNECFIPNGRPLDTGTGTGGQAHLQRDTGTGELVCLGSEDSQYSVRPKSSSISVTDLFQTFASICGLATPLLRSSLHHMRVR